MRMRDAMTVFAKVMVILVLVCAVWFATEWLLMWVIDYFGRQQGP